MTLDAPFEINMGSGDSIERDGAAGCIGTFCLQYTLGGPSGAHFVKGGLAFVQHLTSKKHFTNLQISVRGLHACMQGMIMQLYLPAARIPVPSMHEAWDY